ncbi:hypothetical protein ABW19_dt0204390 [Dactylella cylindrospora]|nr:hypothetical protein ABW19_dt0204390 [Dactylella cylindrospora]
MTTINIGLLGYGLSTTAFHIPTISAVPGTKVYAVVQRSPPPASPSEVKRGDHVTVDYPDVKHYRDATSLFQDPNIHLIVICTPSPGHYDLAKEALENGKHVIVEKPFCPTVDDCTSLISIAASRNLLLTVYQNRRLDSDFLTLRKLLSSSPTSSLLNPIISVTSQFNRYRPSLSTSSSVKAWKNEEKPGNGILYDLGSHLIDQILYLFGLPDWLWAHTDNQKQSDPLSIDDSFSLYLYYSANPSFNGGKPLTVELKSSMISPVEKQSRWIVKGWKGTFKKFGMDVQEDQLRAYAIDATSREDYGAEPHNEWPELTISTDDLSPEEEAGVEGLFKRDVRAKEGWLSGKITPERGDYVGYYKNVVGCIRRVVDGEEAEKVKGDLLVKAEEARNVIGVIEAARESAKTGSRVEIKKKFEVL